MHNYAVLLRESMRVMEGFKGFKGFEMARTEE